MKEEDGFGEGGHGMKTRYSDIVDVNAIGRADNPLPLHAVLGLAGEEDISSGEENVPDGEKVLFIGIDVQQDFMEGGALGVPGSCGDVARLTRFLYENMGGISDIVVSLDTHIPRQIFHPCWWLDGAGHTPAPYTTITLADLDEGRWRPVREQAASREYVEHLEREGKKTLCIWPYHCIQGTAGAALENQFANMVSFFSVARKRTVEYLVKGQDPLSEMYGIIRPEYDTRGYVNKALLDRLEKYDRIVIAGEASSHCVLESVRQILTYYADRPEITGRMYMLQDCMSSIPGYEESTERAFADFQRIYGVRLVRSTDGFLRKRLN